MNVLAILGWILFGTAVGIGVEAGQSVLTGYPPHWQNAATSGVAVMAIVRAQFLWTELRRVRRVAARNSGRTTINVTPAPSAQDRTPMAPQQPPPPDSTGLGWPEQGRPPRHGGADYWGAT